MIETRIPINSNFDYEECEQLYKKHQKAIGDDQEFSDIAKGTYFYSFYSNNELLGCIYCYIKDEKLYLNGFAERHHHSKNMECMKLVLSWFNCDIYAESVNKTAIYCLYRCGFKKIDKDLYKYER